MGKIAKRPTRRKSRGTPALPSWVRRGNPAGLRRLIADMKRRAAEATPEERRQADAEIALVINSMNADRVRAGMRKLTAD